MSKAWEIEMNRIDSESCVHVNRVGDFSHHSWPSTTVYLLLSDSQCLPFLSLTYNWLSPPHEEVCLLFSPPHSFYFSHSAVSLPPFITVASHSVSAILSNAGIRLYQNWGYTVLQTGGVKHLAGVGPPLLLAPDNSNWLNAISSCFDLKCHISQWQ